MKNIQQLYHFTDSSNIPSIVKNKGLYSRSFCNKNNLVIINPGGNNLSYERDKKKGLTNYVRVSFVRVHPMLIVSLREDRIRKAKILKISPEIIYLNTTKFSFKNAAKDNSFVFDDIENFKKITFSLFDKEYLKLDGEQREQFQAEILVETKIPIHFISEYD